MRKVLVALCFMLLFTMTVTGQASAKTTFSDIGSSHRAQAEIYYLVEKGITGGVSSTQFAPDREVTRGEAAAMLGRVLGLDGRKKSTKFSDVPATHGFSGYIQDLVDRKIISGYDDGTFKPNRTLTRGEMALLINRTFKFGGESISVATKTLMDKGIALGMTDGTFGEGNKIKRADFAVFLARSMNADFRVPEGERFTVKMYVDAGSDTLNLRSGPGTSYPSIGKLPTGTVVLYASSQGDWAYIQAGSKTGYVHKGYLTKTEPVRPPSPSAPGTNKKLSDLVVIIDPGHGGRDPGALGHGYAEKNIVLNIGLKMKAYYDKTPIQAKMTRTGDTYPSLGDRVTFARQNKGDIFVSIHANSCCGANGQETFYYTAATNPHVNESKALAIYVQNRMQEAWNLTNRGVKKGNLHVLRENTMPAVLAEIGFIDSAKDMQVMGTEAGRQQMAKALFLATLDYYYHYENRQDVLPLYDTVGGKPSARRH